MRFPWTDEELILALDLYLRHAPNEPDESSPEVGELSALLQALPIHPLDQRDADFRTRDSVHLKLMNFRAEDPNGPSRGMSKGGPHTRRIWQEYGHRPADVAVLAQQVRAAQGALASAPLEESEQDDAGANEGGVTLVMHKRRERSRSLARKKRNQVLRRDGLLRCEACGLDGEAIYGSDVGGGVFECHHRLALSEVGASRTRLADLAIVCANCHRAVHGLRPTMSVDDLRARLARND